MNVASGPSGPEVPCTMTPPGRSGAPTVRNGPRRADAVGWDAGRSVGEGEGLAPTSAPGLPVPEQQSAAAAGWVGRVLAGHRIDALIGEGGMGVVYRASHLQLRRTVALKVLPPPLTADQEYRHRFEREAAIAASLEHPNVVPIYDAGHANGVLYLSMRFVDGEDLGAVLQRHGRLDVEPLCAVLGPVADALDAVHAAGSCTATSSRATC